MSLSITQKHSRDRAYFYAGFSLDNIDGEIPSYTIWAFFFPAVDSSLWEYHSSSTILSKLDLTPWQAQLDSCVYSFSNTPWSYLGLFGRSSFVVWYSDISCSWRTDLYCTWKWSPNNQRDHSPLWPAWSYLHWTPVSFSLGHFNPSSSHPPLLFNPWLRMRKAWVDDKLYIVKLQEKVRFR